MIRLLYICLLHMHPARFMYRFGNEMLADFDDGRAKDATSGLLLDAVVSLFRQWLLRPAPKAVLAPQTAGDGPAFSVLEEHRLSPQAKVNGALLSTVLLTIMIFAIGRGGTQPSFLIGARDGRQGLLTISRDGLKTEKSLDTEILFPKRRPDPLLQRAEAYYKNVLILGALDRDKDYTISRRELNAATTCLRALDRDADGALNAEECGWFLGHGVREQLSAEKIRRTMLDFMQANPAIATIDRDGDGRLSSYELRNARASLTRLDRNRDGNLSPAETLPDTAVNGRPSRR